MDIRASLIIRPPWIASRDFFLCHIHATLKTRPNIMDIALYQPDIPQNLGAILRIGACFGACVHIIEPCGFPLDEKRIRRSGMDYIDHVTWQRHASYDIFCTWAKQEGLRVLLATTRAETHLESTYFLPNDIVLFGRESAGVPDNVHDSVDARFSIRLQPGMRSLNLAVSVGIVVWEAQRQLCNTHAIGTDVA